MTIVTRARRVLPTLGALAASAALLAGCGGGSDGGTRATHQSTPPTSSTSTSPSGSPTASSPSPSITPAAGSAMTMTGFTMNAPPGWVVRQDQPIEASAFDPKDTVGQIEVGDFTATSLENVDTAAKDGLSQAKGSVKNATRVADREVNGVSGYVITGSSKTYPVYYQYGTVHDGRIVSIEIDFGRPPQDVQQVIESVLASVTWSG